MRLKVRPVRRAENPGRSRSTTEIPHFVPHPAEPGLFFADLADMDPVDALWILFKSAFTGTGLL